MHRTIFLVFLLALSSQQVLSAGFSKFSTSVPIRVRLFKDLEKFPVIQNAKWKVLAPGVWSVEGPELQYQNKKLAPRNFVFRKDSAKYDLIGLFDFNSYLAGVVSKEMPLSWPLEALKAQAVIARSFALARMAERKNRIFHLDTDQMDQVFAVTNSEKAKLAVFTTDQIVLKDQKDRVLKAFYHADCGGQTIPASKVWNDAVDAGTAIDPWCAARKSNEWTLRIPRDEFYEKLMSGFKTESTENLIAGEINPFSVAEKFKSRVQSLSWQDQIIPIQKIRQIFGFSTIRNSPLSLSESENQILIKGKGYGHGVGLCQWGTQAQAKLGRSFTQILEHYYPEAHLSQQTMKLSKAFLSDLVFN